MDVQPQGADAPSFDEELIEPVGSSRNVSTLSSHVLRPLTVGFSSTREVFCLQHGRPLLVGAWIVDRAGATELVFWRRWTLRISRLASFSSQHPLMNSILSTTTRQTKEQSRLNTLPSSRQAERPQKECAGAPDTQLDDIMSETRDVKNEHASRGIGRRSVPQRKVC